MTRAMERAGGRRAGGGEEGETRGDEGGLTRVARRFGVKRCGLVMCVECGRGCSRGSEVTAHRFGGRGVD